MEAPYSSFSEVTEETSQQFVGRWMTLISTTNWEKGHIIAEWRQALVDADAVATEYSDEAWSRRIGNISSQHTGRLRRTFARFGQVCSEYRGLYWSHFQAALDWEDAEMWLEGAVQNEWSVSEMRRERWQTLGGVRSEEPQDAQIVNEEFDADALDERPAEEIPRSITSSHSVIAEADEEVESARDDSSSDTRTRGNASSSEDAPRDDLTDDRETPAAASPFADLPELPDDLHEAFESFKLAILLHKLAGWTQISRQDVLTTLHALEQLATASSD